MERDTECGRADFEDYILTAEKSRVEKLTEV